MGLSIIFSGIKIHSLHISNDYKTKTIPVTSLFPVAADLYLQFLSSLQKFNCG